MNLCYAYAAEPLDGLDDILAEHERCTELWDELVRIDRAHDDRERQAALADDPEMAALEAAIDVLKSKLDDGQERGPLIRELRARRREWREHLWAWRKDHKEAVRGLERDRQEAVKAARQATDAWWPNYNSVIRRFEAARKLCRQGGRKRVQLHNELRDDGMLEVQIQRTRSGMGASPDEVHDGLSMIEIDPPKGKVTTARMRVDVEGNRARLLVHFHRPLPPGRIKLVQLSWRRVADEVRWQLSLSLADLQEPAPASFHRTGTISLCYTAAPAGDTGDLAYHATTEAPPGDTGDDNSSMVAGTADLMVADGDARLILPARWMARMDRVEVLKSWLDTSRKAAIAAAPERLRETLEMPEREMMDVLLARLRKHSPPRKVTLPCNEHACETPRALAEQAIVARDLLEWRRWWRHVWLARAHLLDKLLAERKNIYRCWASRIAGEYSDITLDDLPLAQLAIEDRGSEENSLRHRACLHQLREAIVHAAHKAGCRVIASGKVLTEPAGKGKADKSGVWQKRKAGKTSRDQERSQNGRQA